MLKRGFTIVELLIVITVIGIIAAIGTVGYNGTQAKARDAQRRSDVERVADSLSLYYQDTKSFVEAGSGCGSVGNGNGWLLYTDGVSTGYPRRIVDCLMDGGYIQNNIADPSGAKSGSTGLGSTGTNTPNKTYTYMKYHCGAGSSKKAYVFAKLETVAQSMTATDATCNTTADSDYGMNYFVEVQ